MLERVLEPEVMDSPEEASDYDAMDHSAVNSLFVADFLRVWNRQSPILDVGTGTAQIPIEFCRQSPDGTVLAVDLAESMIQLGRDNVLKAGFAWRVELQKINGRSMSFVDKTFPAVMSNSIIHHIPDPVDCFAEMIRVCANGGTIFIRDLMRPEDLNTLEKLVQTYAGDANAHQQKMFAESLHAALTLEEVRAIVRRFGFDPATVQATSDRHWTWAVPAKGPLL